VPPLLFEVNIRVHQSPGSTSRSVQGTGAETGTQLESITSCIPVSTPRVRKPEAVNWPTPQVPDPIGDDVPNSCPQISQMNADKKSEPKTQNAITSRSWVHQDRRLGIMTDRASFNDGRFRVDHRCELPTILSLQVLDGLSALQFRIQAVPETAEAGAPMNRDLRNCCDP
jgi:hypothetical protein